MNADVLKELKAMRGEVFSREEKMEIQKKYGLPELFDFETTSKCILKCEMCLYPQGEITKARKKAFLRYEEFEKIMNDVSFFAHYIQLSGGEPLMNRDLFKMIRYARERKISSWVFTNLQLLGYRDNARKLVEAQPTRIVIALDGLDKDVYEGIRIGGDYDLLLRNIGKLVEEKSKTDKEYPKITVQMVLTKKTMQFEDDFVETARKMGADEAYIKPLGIWPEGDKKYFKLMRERYLIPEGEHPLVRNFLDENDDIIGYREPGMCASTKLGYIGSGGEVIPCWYIQYKSEVMGNAIEEDFLDIWFSEKSMKYRDKMLNDWAHPLCRKCLAFGPRTMTSDLK